MKRQRSKQIIVDHIGVAQFPPICTCCGRQTNRALIYKPEDSSRKILNFLWLTVALLIPLLELVKGLRFIDTPPVKIPFCQKCSSRRLIPLIPLSLLTVSICFALFYFLCDNHTMLTLYVGCCLLIIGFLIYKYSSGQYSFIYPVRVLRYGNTYRYLIRRGPYYELVKQTHSLNFDALRQKRSMDGRHGETRT